MMASHPGWWRYADVPHNWPLTTWQLVALLYLALVFFYHQRHHLAWYSGSRRWLALLDLTLLSFLEYIGTISPLLAMPLRALQIVVLTGQMPVWRNLRSAEKTFFMLYFAALVFSCCCSNFLLLATMPALVYAGLQATTFILLAMLMIGMNYRHIALAAGSLEQAELQRQRQLTALAQEQEQCLGFQRVLFKLLWQHSRQLKRLLQDFVYAQPPSIKLLAALQHQADLLLFMEALLIKKVVRREAVSSLNESVDLPAYLRDSFNQQLWLSDALVEPMAEHASGMHLRLRELNPIARPLVIADFRLWQWIIGCWLAYLLTPGRCCRWTEVLISSNADNQLHLQGIAQLNIQQITPQLEETVSCPLCQKKVRTLYLPYASTLGACNQCLRQKTENLLHKDWDMPPPDKPDTLPGLWLARHLLHRFSLGQVHYGISDGDGWEYWITLVLTNA